MKPASFPSLYSRIRTNQVLLHDVYDREVIPNGHNVSFLDFVKYAPSMIYSTHRELFEEMGGRVSSGLIPVEEFTENYSILYDVDGVRDWTLEPSNDPIVD